MCVTASVKVCLSSPGIGYCKAVEFRPVKRFQKHVPEHRVKLLPSPDRAQCLGADGVFCCIIIYSGLPVPLE
jgi:hypothetical protein